MHPSMWLSLVSTRAYCWLIFCLLGSVLQMCSLTTWPPACVVACSYSSPWAWLHIPTSWTSWDPVSSPLQITKFSEWQPHPPVYQWCAVIPNFHPQNKRSTLHPIIHIIYENICFGIDSRGTPLPQTINLQAPIKCICKQTHRVIPLHLHQDRQTEDVKTPRLLSALFRSLRESADFSYMRYDRLFVYWETEAVCARIWFWHYISS